ncbi:methylated-DNA--[protein]-cysteine S-methyltransferase [Cytophagaceae bacterium DM2B3-1]|uniref:Methylated-DNA--protein-cysteine methyltransferase n=1 Tax=Xanthocytophaga flava TaxID=3048013 RepID=A0ABT7CI09_9BACT|nr:methylated-DNA--[protein]-cysteine S-methyltransferase [Xanthocytophaga flavus]MDJ1493369.1 methylated-DNA--[protein]-cysteine S-methyltransferase [Xanthocytophaga flavus]
MSINLLNNPLHITKEVMYQAILDKDTSFEGSFFTAVKTTGIFCRPTCTARKPKIENVEFYRTTKEAILHGYRPCKVCHPLEQMNETPPYIKVLLDELTQNPSLRITDWDLVQRNIKPHTIRRWFLKNHGITFHAYQRLFRLNIAVKKIQNGESVTTTAYDSGYESLSGFTDTFKSVFRVSPRQGKVQTVIDITRIETPLGTMFACAVEQGICLLEFTDRKMLETEFKTLTKLLNATIIQGPNKHFDILKQQLAEYFSGHRKAFSVSLYSPGTDFQQAVWQELQTIPYGTTRSYKEQAISLKKPESVRAVANANGMNRISILIPCHRVVGSDGTLTGFGGGIWRKQWLLNLEKENTRTL